MSKTKIIPENTWYQSYSGKSTLFYEKIWKQRQIKKVMKSFEWNWIQKWEGSKLSMKGYLKPHLRDMIGDFNDEWWIKWTSKWNLNRD